MWRDLAIALSLANLCYLRVWSELLTYSKADAFWMKHPPSPTDFAAGMLNVLLVGGLFWVGVTLIRRLGNGLLLALAHWGFLFVLLLPLNALRAVLSNRLPYLKSDLFGLLGQRGVALLGLGLGALSVVVLIMWHRRLVHVFSLIVLLLSPLLPITFAQALWKTVKYDPSHFTDKPLAPRLSDPTEETKGARVLWVIFDEMDQRLAFVDRPPDVRLPEFDRLRHEALYATQAYPPGPGTPTSLPAYLTGKPVSGVRELGPDELLIRYHDSERAVHWSTQPNILSRALAAGYNTALVGWYHPYCRVINSSLTACWWDEMAMQHNSMGDSFWQILRNQTRSLFETSLLSVFGQSLSVHHQIRTYLAIRARAKQVASDSGLGLVLVHYPVPHAPHAYDRSTGQFTLRNSPIHGYLDSLELADHTLGELRRTMESARLWDSTTLLVTSDHPYREAVALDGKMDGRIPFLLKLAGQKNGIIYDPPFNAVLTQDLLLAILHGELSSREAVVAWLNKHATPQ